MKEKRRSRIRIFMTVILISAGVTGCQRKIINPLPESNGVAGWAKSGATRVWPAKDLWLYMDGESKQYLQAGLISVMTSDYRNKGALEATVSVYNMKSEKGARQLFEKGRSSEFRPVPIGDAGMGYAQSVLFRKGTVMVRIVSYERTVDSEQELIALARGIVAKL